MLELPAYEENVPTIILASGFGGLSLRYSLEGTYTMQCSAQRTWPARGLSSMRTLGVSVLCLVVFTGLTSAQQTTPAPKPKAEPSAKPKAKSVVTPKGKPAPKITPKRRVGRASKKDAKFVMDPNAKWACDKQTVALEPTWRSNKPITFTFDIRNEGTADLKIKARGG